MHGLRSMAASSPGKSFLGFPTSRLFQILGEGLGDISLQGVTYHFVLLFFLTEKGCVILPLGKFLWRSGGWEEPLVSICLPLSVGAALSVLISCVVLGQVILVGGASVFLSVKWG